MNDEARLMMHIWQSITDYISNSDKQDAANALVLSFVEFGNDAETLYDADGECAFIDRALARATEEQDDEPVDEEY